MSIKDFVQKAINWGGRKSPWIIHFNAGACNGCDIEVVDALTPRFDVERFGLLQQGTPRHADVLVCTGAVTLQTRGRLQQIYDQMPQPKFVIAVGTCACTGGIFDGCYSVAGGIDVVIPVDAYLPGCAARPEALIDTVNKLLAGWEEKQKQASLKPPEPKDIPPAAEGEIVASPPAAPEPLIVEAQATEPPQPLPDSHPVAPAQPAPAPEEQRPVAEQPQTTQSPAAPASEQPVAELQAAQATAATHPTAAAAEPQAAAQTEPSVPETVAEVEQAAPAKRMHLPKPKRRKK